MELVIIISITLFFCTIIALIAKWYEKRHK